MKKIAAVCAVGVVGAFGASAANAAAVATAYLNVTDFKINVVSGSLAALNFTNNIDSSAKLNGAVDATPEAVAGPGSFLSELSVIGADGASYNPGVAYTTNPGDLYYAGSYAERDGDARTAAGARALTDATVVLDSNGDGSSQTNTGVTGFATLTLTDSLTFNLSFLYDYFIRVDLDQPKTSVLASLAWSLEVRQGATKVIDLEAIDLVVGVDSTIDEYSAGGDDLGFLSANYTLGPGTYQFALRQTAQADASLIPEPGSLALAGLGLLGLGALRRRKSA
ncbi:EDSAP-1 family PEP-CTERM protein [Uliginosibacterium sp. H1]|uniref:EDSAP-1 family PEP-CTERM protein n=1 Tax=Uliginosibacterium sp. H1 TaxID=3114757 RepID=UPI002E18A557|nr:EDSAP-1 family PEP-CTERM protein [Uliginosibacterium sp. H1]